MALERSKRRRYLGLTLPYWPTDRFQRALKRGAQGATAPPTRADAPLALYASAKGALTLTAVDPAAVRAGLKRGRSLSDARALAPGLRAFAADPEGDAADFARLCEAHLRYSPIVAGLDTRDIVIDITGCAHLFGGEQAMLSDALARLAADGIAARGAVAGAGGAALALAYHPPADCIAPGEEKTAIAPLPTAALRLEAETVGALNRLGFKSIGQLYDLPRATLTARFGPALARRLDQALGRAPEALAPVRPPPAYVAARRLAEPIAAEDAILALVETLAEDLRARFEADAKGGRRFTLTLVRMDGAMARARVAASRPTRTAAHIARLFKNKLEDLRQDLDAGFGYEVVRLEAAECEPLTPAAASFMTRLAAPRALEDGSAPGAPPPASPKGATPVSDAALVDRLANRLGADNVVRLARRDAHTPERAVRYVSALAAHAPGKMRAPGSRSRAESRSSASLLNINPAVSPAQAPQPPQPPQARPQSMRPLKLLRRPEEIRVLAQAPDGPPARFSWRRTAYRVARASGPERIEGDWRRDEEAPPRDYYRVETPEGWRFWIYRAGAYGDAAPPRWRLHGFFP